MLLDPGSTLSYVTPYVTVGFGFEPEVITESFSIGDSFVAKWIYKIVLCLFLAVIP